MRKVVAIIALLLVALPAVPQSNQSRFTYTHISTATSTLIAAKPSELHAVTINGGAAGAITIVDTTSASSCSGGTTVAVTAAVGTTVVPVTLTYDVATTSGLCITTAAATDVTVSWR